MPLTSRWIAVLIVASLAASPHAAGATREPSLDQVLSNASAYVARFARVLTSIVAEEHYVQRMGIDGRHGEFVETTSKELKSDLLLMREADEGYLEFRDVYEVDGREVRDPGERLERLRAVRASTSFADKMRIREQNSVFNLGDIVRTINTPLMALQVLRRANRPGFKFARAKDTDASIGNPDEAPAGVFRVSTEIWVVEFREHQRGTLIRTTGGRDVPCRGRLWIEPETGRVLMTEIVAESHEVRAQMTVSFKSEPLLGLLVPVEMRESYRAKNRSGTRIETSASYGKFTLFPVK